MNAQLLGLIRRSRADAMRRLDEFGRHLSIDNQATDDQATDNQATDNQATDNQATDNQATDDPAAHDPATGTPATVDRIDDPAGGCAIIVVRGEIDASTVHRLWDSVAQLAHASTIWFDLTDASINRGPWMDELGILADAIEDAGGDVGIVGVDPQHPDLAPRR